MPPQNPGEGAVSVTVNGSTVVKTLPNGSTVTIQNSGGDNGNLAYRILNPGIKELTQAYDLPGIIGYYPKTIGGVTYQYPIFDTAADAENAVLSRLDSYNSTYGGLSVSQVLGGGPNGTGGTWNPNPNYYSKYIQSSVSGNDINGNPITPNTPWADIPQAQRDQIGYSVIQHEGVYNGSGSTLIKGPTTGMIDDTDTDGDDVFTINAGQSIQVADNTAYATIANDAGTPYISTNLGGEVDLNDLSAGANVIAIGGSQSNNIGPALNISVEIGVAGGGNVTPSAIVPKGTDAATIINLNAGSQTTVSGVAAYNADGTISVSSLAGSYNFDPDSGTITGQVAGSSTISASIPGQNVTIIYPPNGSADQLFAVIQTTTGATGSSSSVTISTVPTTLISGPGATQVNFGGSLSGKGVLLDSNDNQIGEATVGNGYSIYNYTSSVLLPQYVPQSTDSTGAIVSGTPQSIQNTLTEFNNNQDLIFTNGSGLQLNNGNVVGTLTQVTVPNGSNGGDTYYLAAPTTGASPSLLVPNTDAGTLSSSGAALTQLGTPPGYVGDTLNLFSVTPLGSSSSTLIGVDTTTGQQLTLTTLSGSGPGGSQLIQLGDGGPTIAYQPASGNTPASVLGTIGYVPGSTTPATLITGSGSNISTDILLPDTNGTPTVVGIFSGPPPLLDASGNVINGSTIVATYNADGSTTWSQTQTTGDASSGTTTLTVAYTFGAGTTPTVLNSISVDGQLSATSTSTLGADGKLSTSVIGQDATGDLIGSGFLDLAGQLYSLAGGSNPAVGLLANALSGALSEQSSWESLTLPQQFNDTAAYNAWVADGAKGDAPGPAPAGDFFQDFEGSLASGLLAYGVDDLLHSAGLTGFTGEAVTAVANSVISQATSAAVSALNAPGGSFSTALTAAEDSVNLGAAIEGAGIGLVTQQVIGAWEASAPNPQDIALGDAIGSAVGGVVFGLELGGELGAYAGPVGAAVGAVVGAIIGSAFGPSHPSVGLDGDQQITWMVGSNSVVPNANGYFAIPQGVAPGSNNGFSIDNTSNVPGGTVNQISATIQDMGTSAVSALNAAFEALSQSSGTQFTNVPQYIEFGYAQSSESSSGGDKSPSAPVWWDSMGVDPNQDQEWLPSDGDRQADPTAAVQQGVYRILAATTITNGDLTTERLVAEDRASDASLDELSGDLKAEADYQSYMADTTTFLNDEEKDPTGLATWQSELSRIEQLGLNQTTVDPSQLPTLDAQLDANLGQLLKQAATAQNNISAFSSTLANAVANEAQIIEGVIGGKPTLSVQAINPPDYILDILNIQQKYRSPQGISVPVPITATQEASAAAASAAAADTLITGEALLTLENSSYSGGDQALANTVAKSGATSVATLNQSVANSVGTIEQVYLAGSVQQLLNEVATGTIPQRPDVLSAGVDTLSIAYGASASPLSTAAVLAGIKVSSSAGYAVTLSSITALNGGTVQFDGANWTLTQAIGFSNGTEVFQVAVTDGVNTTDGYIDLSVGAEPTLTTSQLITNDYYSVLGRAPSTAELDYWTGQVTAGAITATGIGTAQIGPDSPSTKIYSYYVNILGRAPDVQGFSDNMGAYYSRVPQDGAAGALVAIQQSFFDAYLATNPNPTAAINLFYQEVLSRAPETGAVAYYLNAISEGYSLNTILFDFFYPSSEFTVQDHGIPDPLVIGAPGMGLPTLQSIASGATFNDGAEGDAPTGWTAGGSGFLVADTTTGGITQISQILPDATNPSQANTFTALSLYADANGQIKPGDAGYSEIEVWTDSNGNGQVDGGELHTLASLGITSINTIPTVAVLNDNGNLVTLESTYTTSSGQTGVIAQVSFAYGGPDVTVPANASTGSTFTTSGGVQVVLGDGGDDRLSTGGSNVLLDGNGGINVITDTGGSHNDLYGGSGDGTLITNGSYDLLQAVSGNDLLIDNGGNHNILDAGTGDSVLQTSGSGDTLVDGENHAPFAFAIAA